MMEVDAVVGLLRTAYMSRSLGLGLLFGRRLNCWGTVASPVPCLEISASGLVRSILGIFSIGSQISSP